MYAYMPYAERKKPCGSIESLRKRPLMVYVTSTRQGNGGQIGSDAIPEESVSQTESGMTREMLDKLDYFLRKHKEGLELLSR